jgi:hypothetical protein
MSSFKGSALFMLVFVGIAPQSRAFLGNVFNHTAEFLIAWSPFSYILLAMFLAGPLVSVFVMKTWPEKEEPENPLAKYKNEVPYEE